MPSFRYLSSSSCATSLMASRLLIVICAFSGYAVSLRVPQQPGLITSHRNNGSEWMYPFDMETESLGFPSRDDVLLQYLMSERSGIMHRKPRTLNQAASYLMSDSLRGIGNYRTADLGQSEHDAHARGASPYEFGWETSVMVPHAYASVLDGSINITRSCGDLSALYWFSPKHENLPSIRNQRIWKEWYGIKREVLMSDVPDNDIPKWLPPPHKDYYSKFPAHPKLFQPRMERSIMVVNKFTYEWDHKPTNYFSEALLAWMITRIEDKCPSTQMVYERNRILNTDASAATDELNSLRDFDLLRARDRVVFMEDVMHSSTSSFNEANMRAMAKHKCFASVQGGLMSFVSQFGGKHIVLHREGSETDAFYARLSRMGRGEIFVVRPTTSKYLNAEAAFKKLFEREFLRDSCKSCGIVA